MLEQIEDRWSGAIALLVIAGVGAAVLLGCNSDLGIDEQTYECATDADCGEGFECWTGQCADGELLIQRCDQYCDDFMDICNDRLVGPELTFDDLGECQEVCDAYPINGVEGDDRGDTLECRRHHLELAKLSNPTIHCAHASPRGKNFCGDTTTKECLFFCYDLLDSCTRENRPFDTPQDCLEECEVFRDDGTFDCRESYVEDALQGFEISIACENAAAETPICEER